MPRKRSEEGKAGPTPQQQWRQWLVQADHDASQDYDKTVLTLAHWDLALSVTFAHDIAPKPIPGSSILLACAWLALGLSPSSSWSLFSRVSSASGTRSTTSIRPQCCAARAGRPATGFLNVGSGVLLITGLIASLGSRSRTTSGGAASQWGGLRVTRAWAYSGPPPARRTPSAKKGHIPPAPPRPQNQIACSGARLAPPRETGDLKMADQEIRRLESARRVLGPLLLHG